MKKIRFVTSHMSPQNDLPRWYSHACRAKKKYCLSPDLSCTSQIRTNAINATVDMNDSQAYVSCNGDTVIFSVMVIPSAKYASDKLNTCANNSIIWMIERALCKWNSVWYLNEFKKEKKLDETSIFSFELHLRLEIRWKKSEERANNTDKG